MAQKLKTEVRERILAASETVFARAGYGGATMADIAEVAGVSTGNLYRYFAGKDELFYTVFTDEFAAELLAVVRRRVASLTVASDLIRLDDGALRDGEALLSFWIEHRNRVIVLLGGAAGSRYEDFAARFVDALVEPSLATLRDRAGEHRLPRVVSTTLQDIFQNTVRTIVSILGRHRTEANIREAFAAFWSYQLAGLAGLERWVTR